MKLFLPILILCFSLPFAQGEDPNSDIDLELMSPDMLKNELLRRKLVSQGSANASDSFNLALSRAAVFYYDKKWDSAYSVYMPLLEKVSDFLYGPLVIRVAKCELERKNIKESRKLLLSLKSLKSNKNSWERADRILVEGILRDAEITEDAKKDSIERRLKAKPGTSYDQFLKWKLAAIYTKQNNQQGARDAYFSILKGSGPYADSAFKILLWLTPNSDDYDFVRILCRRGNSEKCAERATSIFSKNIKLDSAKWVNLMILQADAWKQLSRTNLAMANYKKLLDSIGYNSAWMQSLIRMARTAGNKQEVKRLDSIFQKKFPFSTENANNLWVKALEFEQAKEYDDAIETYKQLYNAGFGKNLRRQWAKFRVGFINFKQDKIAEAAKIFAEAASENLGLMPRSASLYFYADCERLLGNMDKATKAYFASIEDFPLGYYAWRSRQALTEFDLSKNISKVGRKMSEDSLTIWLRNLQKNESGLKDSVVSLERLEQIKVLLRSGFEEEALEFYNEAFRLHKNRPEFYYRYGLMFMQNSEYALGHRLARNFLEMVPRQKIAGTPIQVLKFLFPVPHEDKVKKHAGKIDPFFIYSIMRQESMFDAKIQSPAGAKGLMQIMPATGDFLAKREKIEKYNKDLLFNAYMNIRLGIRYLRDLTEEHKGDYIGVLGEYNAGPAPANRWLANYGSLSWDIRVEEVSYWETRDYVKKVLANYLTYKEIYGSD
jgi:soluble lytic murein transglycosylase